MSYSSNISHSYNLSPQNPISRKNKAGKTFSLLSSAAKLSAITCLWIGSYPVAHAQSQNTLQIQTQSQIQLGPQIDPQNQPQALQAISPINALPLTDLQSTDLQGTDLQNLDDGTYKILAVASDQECFDLCQADSDNCRGSIIIQPDKTKPYRECRLNNGKGSQPAFPRTAPPPLDLNIALSDLNAYRASKGLSALSLSSQLNAVSQSHADDRAQAGKISHQGSDGKSHGDRLLAAGYKFRISAENVASGQKSWAHVFKAWQDSPGHNVNLLNDEVTEFGAAMRYNPDTSQSIYWVMLVAKPFPTSPSLFDNLGTGENFTGNITGNIITGNLDGLETSKTGLNKTDPDTQSELLKKITPILSTDPNSIPAGHHAAPLQLQPDMPADIIE